jgi:hypothetical protein
MVTKTALPIDKDAATEPGYADWKRGKIERGIKQAQDRDSLIPAAQVWQKLGLER